MRNREGLLLPVEESRIAEILAQNGDTTRKAGDDRQYDSYQPDECDWTHPDGGGSSGSQVVDLSGHTMHDDAQQRRHLSGITPARPPDHETPSGSPRTAHMRDAPILRSSRDEQEENMEQLVDLGLFLGGLGVFFVGIGVLYGVSVWDKK